MPKMIVSIDGVVIKEVQLTKDRTTLGRRPYNDVVIDNLAISGEHAVFQMAGSDVFIEDLNSTNGTYVNGKAAKKQQLNNGDTVEVGKYKIKFVSEAVNEGFEKTMMVKSMPTSAPAPLGAAPASGTPSGFGPTTTSAPAQASIKVLSGAASGREVPLTKVVTTIGKPGVAVAAITRRQHGFVVHHVEGAGNPSLNGTPIGTDPVSLKNGDLIELAGTQMQFVQS
jgi:pSer/pThr/pTyr-binding forkhead associated (FHA) protein